MVSKGISIGLNGLDGFITEIETDCRREESTDIEIVGLPDTTIKEAKERVKSALYNSGFIISDKKTVINLAPANIRKEGPSFDLAMVIGILASMGTISKISEDTAFIGEISLSGKIRPCSGILAMVISAKALGIKKIFCLLYTSRCV